MRQKTNGEEIMENANNLLNQYVVKMLEAEEIAKKLAEEGVTIMNSDYVQIDEGIELLGQALSSDFGTKYIPAKGFNRGKYSFFQLGA